YYGGGDYAGMLKTVYPKIKAANPEAQVLVGGLLLDCDPVNPPAGKNCTPSKYLEGILQNGGGSYFDGVSFHAYDFYNSTYNTYGSPNWNSGRWANETDGELKPVLIAKVSYLKNLLNSYGASNKFLINTEVALLCGGGSDPPGGAGCESDPTSPYELLKAYYISQAYAAAIAEGLLGNIWYSPTGWRNSGLLNPDLSTRPAYDAYALARSTLKNATLLRTITEYHDPNNVFGYEFSIDGRRIWVVWVLDGSSQTIALPASSSSVSAWDALGVSVDVSSGNLAIGALNTVYVEWIP
ncbi:MAG: hypothetical protein ACE5GO_05225, partial [Anaerolineales bacterium]